MTTPKPALPFWPRLLSREQAARYCGVSADTFDGLVDRGAVPKSVTLPGVRRVLWDRGRLDDALDRLVGGIHEAGDGSREARKTMAAAGADLSSSGLRFHDIRGTTVTRLYDAGCTDAEVASITGHAIGGGSMLRAYAARTRTLALNAYQRWWQAMQGGVVLNFGKKFPVSQNDGV